MIVLRCVLNFEHDRYLRIKTVQTKRGEIRFSIKNQAIGAIIDRVSNQEEWFDSPIRICPGMTEFGPTLIGVLDLQTDRDAARRRSARRVEDMS